MRGIGLTDDAHRVALTAHGHRVCCLSILRDVDDLDAVLGAADALHDHIFEAAVPVAVSGGL